MIYQIDNFVDPNICKELVDWFRCQSYRTVTTKSFYDNRTIEYKDIHNIHIKQLINAIRTDVTFKVRHLFNEQVYADFTSLVYWPDGYSMDIHMDNKWLDGSPNYVPYRKYSSVIYLNDDYKGGQTIFPEFENIQPKTGKLLIFPSHYLHGVEKVEGERYTLPIWFTDNIQFIEL
jgi:predicted 2-oxoglutarate/Fe(II)-dependent dioxygenase YbiX